jgi:hypothetical protein
MGFCWNIGMICPRWGIIGKNYPYFHKLGLTGHTTQGHDDVQRLYWNVRQPYKEIIADYCQARFGKAGPAMIEYYDRLEKAVDDAPDLYSNGRNSRAATRHRRKWRPLTPGTGRACDSRY